MTTARLMPDLAPCPFCGETKEFTVVGDWLGWPVAFVVCGTCHTRGPSGESPDQARANWNRRPTSTLGGIHRQPPMAPSSSCPRCGLYLSARGCTAERCANPEGAAELERLQAADESVKQS